MGKYHRRITRHGDAVLFVFLHSAVYRFYKRRFASWRYFFVPDFFTNG
jgi:hypothetical protein